MRGAYDDLSSETTWTSDNDRMPQDYLDGVMAQINAVQPGKCLFDTYDPKNIWDRRNMANLARDYSLSHPRDGQPCYEAGIKAWCAEAFKREAELRSYLYRLRQRNAARRQH